MHRIVASARPLACLLVLLSASLAHAQTSVLTPFTVTGRVVLTAPRGPRPLSGLVLEASSTTVPPWILSGRAAFSDDPSTPETNDGRYTLPLPRDVNGTLLRYDLQSALGQLPTLQFDGGMRWLSVAQPAIDAPGTGDVRRDLIPSGLCHMYVDVRTTDLGAVSDLMIEAVVDKEAAGGIATSTEATTTTDPTGVGFVRSLVGGRQHVLVEFLMPSTGLAKVSGRLMVGPEIETVAQVEIDLAAQDCRNIRAPTVSSAAHNGIVPIPVRGSLAVVPDPTRPTADQPLATSWQVSLSRPQMNGVEVIEQTVIPEQAGATVPYGLKVIPSNWDFLTTAQLLFPFGGAGSLTVPRAFADAFSPSIRPPVGPSPQQGVYLDGSVLVSGGELEERASVAAQLTLVEGRIVPRGCVGPQHVQGGSVSLVGIEDGPATVFVDENGRSRVAPTGALGGRAVAPIAFTGGRYILPTTVGTWEETALRLSFGAPGRTTDEQPVTELDLKWLTPPPPIRVTAGAPPPEERHDLPLSAINVTLRVRDPVTGAPRPFLSPTVETEGVLTDDSGAPVANWSARAYGSATLANEQRVVLLVPPGTMDVRANARVPVNSDGSGGTALTSFPPITAVPARPPRPDGSCAAVCTDQGTNVFWDDDLAPPTLVLDAEPPTTTRAPTLVISGRVSDESPITRVLVGTDEATLAGSDTDTTRTFTHTLALAPGANTVFLTAIDRCGGRLQRRLDINRRMNIPPTLFIDERLTVREGDRLEARATAFDEDEDQNLTYRLTHGTLPGSARPRIDPLFGVVSWTPGFDQSGVYTLEVAVTDGEATTTSTVEVEVLDVNRPPVVDRIGGEPVEPGVRLAARENEPFTAQVDAHDPDGDTLTFALDGSAPEGLTIDPVTGLVTWLPGFDGPREVLVTIVARDPAGLEDSVTVLIEIEDVNRPPELSLPEPVQGRETEPLTFTIRAFDPDLDPIEPVVTPPRPGFTTELQPGDVTMQLVVRWTPGFDDAGLWTVPVVVDDGRGGRVEGSVEIEIANTNRAPVITSFEPPVVDGFPGELELVVTDPDGDAVTCIATELPEFTTYEDQWRRLSWSGDLKPTGLRTVRLRCTDGTETTDYEGALRGAPGVLTGGCDCTSGGSPAWTALLAGLLVVRRRREYHRLARGGGPV